MWQILLRYDLAGGIKSKYGKVLVLLAGLMSYQRVLSLAKGFKILPAYGKSWVVPDSPGRLAICQPDLGEKGQDLVRHLASPQCK